MGHDCASMCFIVSGYNLSVFQIMFVLLPKASPTDRNNPTDVHQKCISKSTPKFSHGLKNTTGEKLYQWVSSIGGRSFSLSFQIRWVVSIRWCFFITQRMMDNHSRSAMLT
jgi:hypothetical protein